MKQKSVNGEERRNAVGVSREGTRRAGPNPLSVKCWVVFASLLSFGCNSDSGIAPSGECEGKRCNSTDSDDKSSGGKGRSSDEETTTDTSSDTRETSAGELTSGATSGATSNGRPTVPTYTVCDPVTEKGCGGEAPWCLGEGELGADGGLLVEPRCVECEEDAHCEFPYVEKDREGVCIGNRCGCDTKTHYGCGGETPACSEAPGGKRLCVACTSDEHCTSPAASRCDVETNVCVPCNDVGQCAHLSETPACDVSRGRCVECTPDEDVACEGRACNAVKGSAGYQTCSEFEKGSTLGCEECVSDEQCAEGHECVHETISGHFRQPTGKRFCMAVAVDDCAGNTPFLRPRTERSMSGEEKTYCTLNDATCASYALYGKAPDLVPENEPGAGQATCLGNDSCGYGWVGGACVKYTETTNRCSYSCRTDQDCPQRPAPVQCVGRVCALP